MKADRTVLLYTAGFFDGEGCIYRPKKHGRQLVIVIANTNLAVLQWIQTRLGLGRIYKHKGGTMNTMPVYHLRISGNRNALEFLEAVNPYLIVKRDLAEQFIKEEKNAILAGQRHASRPYRPRNKPGKTLVPQLGLK